MKILSGIFFFLFFFSGLLSTAQQLFTENFNYTTGQALTANNWTLASSSTSPNVAGSGLTYSGYVLSNIGNAAVLNTVGQGVCRDGFASVSTGSIYTSFMLNVTSATATGDYIFSILPQGATGLNTSFGRVFVKSAGTGYFKLGVSQFNSATYGNIDSFAFGSTILVVTKYQFGTTDSCSVFGFSSGFPATEPTTPGAIITNSITSPPTGFGRFVIRFGTNSPACTVDGIRSGQTWSDLNAATSNSCPAVSSPSFNPNSGINATISWTKPSAFNSSTMTTLVFLKANSAITIGTPTALSTAYTANSNFSASTSTYQNDANAKCVYNDTNNTVNITGLSQGITYYALIYILRNTDTVYSAAVTTNGATPITAPGVLTTLSFSATGQSTATVSWTRPTGYNISSNSIVIFAKALSSVTQGTPSSNPSNYIANSLFGNGSFYQNDGSAFCIYNGDSSRVLITGLTPGTTYYLLGYAVNDADSSYSPAATSSGTTNPPTPQAVTGLTFTATGSTSATIKWNKGTNYYNSSFTTLVFVKQNAPITQGTPNKSPNYYSANSLFGSGSTYQNDAAAFCVFKGDTNFVSITGLTSATNYAVLVYVVRDVDSVYSAATTGAGASGQPPPNPVTNATFTAVSSTSARIAWTPPAGGPGAPAILVFVKQGSPITLGTPTHAVTYYNAPNPASPFGTPYQNDAAAGCVFRNTNPANVIITGLNPSYTYYIAIYAERINDSSYSSAVTLSGSTAPPVDVTNLVFGGTSTTTANISWTRPAGYSNSAYTTLVFVEQGGVVNKGTPTSSPSIYTANTIFGAGTPYQNDGYALCVYNGDSNFVNVTSLNNLAPYYVLVYVVRNSDSAYSNPGSTTSGSVLTAPPPPPSDVSGVSFTGLSQTTAQITWTKPAGYINSVYTTLVFVKKNLSVTIGTPTKSLTTYVANPNTSLGSVYENDNLARCVYKGDTNFVNITNLNYPANYYVLIWVIRDVDSVYSPNGATGSGSALTPPPPPLDVSNLTFSGLSTTAANINWTKPSNYDNSSLTTLVFVKQSSTINTGTPTRSPLRYNANSYFGLGSSYQNDPSARCVYKGDTNFVDVTNLNNSSTYYVLVYVVHDVDSVYSVNGATASGSALPNPPPPPSDVTYLTFAGLTTTAAKISWIKPSGYNNATLSTLVFAKQISTINAGTPTKATSRYNANPFFGLGTPYENDASGICVFKGDTNFVNIGNLFNGQPYYVLVYVVTDYDSVYSVNGDTVSGWALPTPPPPLYYSIAQVNHTDAISGVPDSVGVRVGLKGIVYGFNTRPPGVEFVLRDNTGGITVSSGSSSFGYTVTEGDTVEVVGTINTARGLVVISALDTLKLHGTGKSLKTPSVVTKMSESTENDLVQINNLQFVNIPAGGVWQGGTNTRCSRIGSTDTINVFLPPNDPLAGQPLPTTTAFDLIGLGKQQSTSLNVPYLFDGYFLVPRKASDVSGVTIFSRFSVLNPSNNSNLLIYSTQPAIVNTFNWSKCKLNIGIDTVKYLFQLDTINGNFTNPRYFINLTDTTLGLTSGTLASVIAKFDLQFSGKWRVIASASSVAPNIQYSDSIFFLNITLKSIIGINEATQISHSANVYPNPTTGSINISSDETISEIIISDVIGKEIYFGKENRKEFIIDGTGWNKGIYFVKIKTENSQFVKRIIIQ